MTVDAPTAAQSPDTATHRRIRTLPVLAAIVLSCALALLALGYWSPWLAHPVAGLNILGVDLAEYVKFVPEVVSGQIAIKREVFFAAAICLATGLILLATLQRPAIPVWLRVLFVMLSLPAALSMLPPAWTPALLATPEFRSQMLYIALIFLGAVVSPLLYRSLPDWVRGIFYLLLVLLPLQSLLAFQSLIPALESLYANALKPGLAFYLIALSSLFLIAGGLLLLVIARRDRKEKQ